MLRVQFLYTSLIYVCFFFSQVHRLLIADILEGGREPLRIAVGRRWEVSRHPRCPRYVGLWTAEPDEVTDDIALVIPKDITKITAFICKNPEEDETNAPAIRHDLFCEVRARSGVRYRRAAEDEVSSSSDDDEDAVAGGDGDL